jgi:serine/threonine protein kinase
LAYDTKNNNRKVAVKILNDNLGDDEMALLNNEITIMNNLNHKHVVKYLSHGQADYIKPSGKKSVSYIALEIAEKGELFDFIANTGAFCEETSRYYFKQLISGLEDCHALGVSHRDMKAENCFMDEKYNL